MEDYLELCFDQIGKVPEGATVEEFAPSWLDKIEQKFKAPVFNRLYKITKAWTATDLRVRADTHFGGELFFSAAMIDGIRYSQYLSQKKWRSIIEYLYFFYSDPLAYPFEDEFFLYINSDLGWRLGGSPNATIMVELSFDLKSKSTPSVLKYWRDQFANKTISNSVQVHVRPWISDDDEILMLLPYLKSLC